MRPWPCPRADRRGDLMRLRILLVLPMSGAILAQAALDGSTVLRFVQTCAVLCGLAPHGLFFLIAVAGPRASRRARARRPPRRTEAARIDSPSRSSTLLQGVARALPARLDRL